MREPEAPADDAAVAEERAHVLGAGARRDVEVLGLAAEEEVAHAAADEVGLVAAALEAPDDLGGVGVDAVLVEDDVVADEARAGVALELVAGAEALLARRRLDAEDGQLRRSGRLIVGRPHRSGSA